MFSSLPKLVDKNFVLGFLLPVLLTAIALAVLYRETALLKDLYSALGSEDFSAALTVVGVTIWITAVLLMLCNNGLYRFLEGYIGPFKNQWWRERRQAEFDKESKYLDDTYAAITKPESAATPETRREYFRRLRIFAERFPHLPHLVLPTRFGNVIRSFETYPLRVYGVDSIPTWLRMAAVIPKDFTSAIDSARTEVNFFINSWLLSLVVAGLALGSFASDAFDLWDAGQPVTGLKLDYPISSLAAIAIAIFAYRLATERAVAWGGVVKSAFDLYLPALARQLGYSLPATRARREQFWDAVNSMLLYRQAISPESWPAAPAQPPSDAADDSPGTKGDEDDSE